MFVVGTVTDHVAPWKSVFKIRGSTAGYYLADVGWPTTPAS
jgi:poly(3-hydroxyalkanoate) synthetase